MLHAQKNFDLFSQVIPYSSGYLKVDETHELFWEQSGNPDGIPILVLHGGPGAGASGDHRRFFDPDYFRIIIFDQRGAGRSSPLGSLENNTCSALISDIEKLRQHLQIKQWHIFGGSWGATLALLYALEHKEYVSSMILRGIFLLSAEEVFWFLYEIKNIFPEAWEQFAAPFDIEERKDILKAYYDRLTSPDITVQTEAAVNWSLYESACASLLPNYVTITTDEQKDYARALARIEAHFFLHEVIDDENSIISRINKIRNIPTMIIQGRYDILCPIKSAYNLHAAWPEAEYIVVADAGHSCFDPPLRSRLIEATEHIKTHSQKT